MSMAWVAVGSAVLGAGASLYGANKQSQAVKDASAQNAATQAEQNRVAWSNYLMTRGINPAGAQLGEIPQNAQAINSRLPLWANANFATGPRTGWRRRGAGSGPAPNTLSRGPAGGYAVNPLGGDAAALGGFNGGFGGGPISGSARAIAYDPNNPLNRGGLDIT